MVRILPYRTFTWTTAKSASAIQRRFALELADTTARILVGSVDAHGFTVRRNEREGRRDKAPVAVGTMKPTADGQTEVRVLIRARWPWMLMWAFTLVLMAGLLGQFFVLAIRSDGTCLGPAALAALIFAAHGLGAYRFSWEAPWLERVLRQCIFDE